MVKKSISVGDILIQYDLFIFGVNRAYHASYHHTHSLFYCSTPVWVLNNLNPVFKQCIPSFLHLSYATWVSQTRRVYQRSAKKVGQIDASLRNVHDQIQRYCHRKSLFFSPPVNMKKLWCYHYEDFWLSVNCLKQEIWIELRIDGYSQMSDEQLVIMGMFNEWDHAIPYAHLIRKMGKLIKNIHYLGLIYEEGLKTIDS